MADDMTDGIDDGLRAERRPGALPVGAAVDKPNRHGRDFPALGRHNDLPGGAEPDLGVRDTRGRVIAPATEVAPALDQRDRQRPGLGQVRQNRVAVAGRQPDPVLQHGQHLAAPSETTARPGTEGIQGLKDGDLDQANAAALHRSPFEPVTKIPGVSLSPRPGPRHRARAPGHHGSRPPVEHRQKRNQPDGDG
jgi:hypothetical protein